MAKVVMKVPNSHGACMITAEIERWGKWEVELRCELEVKSTGESITCAVPMFACKMQAIENLMDPSVLVGAIADEDVRVVWKAAQKLSDMTDRSIIPQLVEYTEPYWEPWTRSSAVEILGKLATPSDTDVLMKLNRLLSDEDEFVRRTAAEAIATVNNQEVIL